MLLGSTLVYEVTIDVGAVLKRSHWQLLARAAQIRVSSDYGFTRPPHLFIIISLRLVPSSAATQLPFQLGLGRKIVISVSTSIPYAERVQ